jgi:hypothetical protein
LTSSSLRRLGALVPTLLISAVLTLLAGGPLGAQEEVRLHAGDSIRVDGDIVGRILSIDGPTMVLISREAPRCRAGQGHGEAPICDPAPLVRHTLAVDEVVIERRMEKPNLMLRTVGGGVLGAAAFGTVGYFLGPSVGFGTVEGCLENSSTISCGTGEPRYSAEELESLQLASDRKWGTIFFGLIGGTATAVLVNKLSVGWVRIQPVMAVDPENPWGLGVSVPAPR